MPATAPLPLIVDQQSAQPLQYQVYEQLRDLILSGRLVPGMRLPATRALAHELSISRNTVARAYDQLAGEAYVEGQTGAGTFVCRDLPEALLNADFDRPDGPRETGEARALPSERGREIAALAMRGAAQIDLSPGAPDLGEFPFALWSRLLAQVWRRPPLAAADPRGDEDLREAIANYLRTARGVRCGAEQVIVVSGAQQAINLAALALLEHGEAVWIEDPAYPGCRGALASAGCRPLPVPVDGQGFRLDWAQRQAEPARMLCVAPSRQYPLGQTMPLGRRLELLDWSARRQGWIVEDDYDSEFRYAGKPIPALQGLDRQGRVLYVGSFSKVMFPALRIGYLVVPQPLVELICRVRIALDGLPAATPQPALTAFLRDGHFTAHVRRMRRLYGLRRQRLVEAIEQCLPGLLDGTAGDAAGMSVLARLPDGRAATLGDVEVAGALRAAHVGAVAVSPFFARPRPAAGPPARLRRDAGRTDRTGGGVQLGYGDEVRRPRPQQGLLLGFAATPEERIAPAVARMAQVLRNA